jgi:hypothetical protein
VRDGRLEIFAVGVNAAGEQALWHIWQTAGDDWGSWFSHGIPPGSAGLRWAPTLVSLADGRLAVFVVGDDLQPGGLGSGGALYQIRQTAPNNGWSEWISEQPGGPTLFGSPAAIRGADDRLQVFALGADGALWHRWQTRPAGDWSEWVPRGSPSGLSLNSAPAVAAGADGHLEVFIVSQGAELWHLRQQAPDGQWSPWLASGTPSGVCFGSDATPAIAAGVDGCLQLFTVGNDGRLWQQWQTGANGAWSHWKARDAPPGVKFQRLRPAVAPGANGLLQLCVVGDDNDLWLMCQLTAGGDWSPWSRREAPPPAGLLGSPALAAGVGGRLQLFVAGTDGALWHTGQTAKGDWSPWFSPQAPPGSVLLGALTTG